MPPAPVDHATLIWLLGTAAGMTLAAVNAFMWLVLFVLRFDRQQTDDRQDQNGRIALALSDLEERLDRRIGRLEEHSVGYQRHVRGNNGN